MTVWTAKPAVCRNGVSRSIPLERGIMRLRADHEEPRGSQAMGPQIDRQGSSPWGAVAGSLSASSSTSRRGWARFSPRRVNSDGPLEINRVTDRMKIAVWHNLPSGGGKRALHDHVRGLV